MSNLNSPLYWIWCQIREGKCRYFKH